MWAEVNGEKKKVACGPCIRGHRSSKCDHSDRVLIEVRKPGRPLSSCPHPSGSCSCERVVINYTIPKTSGCPCPSGRTQPRVSSVTGPGSRIQKNRRQKSISTPNALLEKALEASENTDADASSLITGTSTNSSLPPSEKSASNGVSPSSSVSSTPRILPSPLREQSQSSDLQLPDAHTGKPSMSTSPVVSSCCRPKLPVATVSRQEPQQQPAKSCCGSKADQRPVPPPVQKSCCSGSNQPSKAAMPTQMHPQLGPSDNYAQLPHFQQLSNFQSQSYSDMNPNFNTNMSGTMNMGAPFSFSIPIYNHMASGYQQPRPVPVHSAHQTNFPGATGLGHSCTCGDSCSCFACPTHPKNPTMFDYVRQMNEFMEGRVDALPAAAYDMPAYPQHSTYGADSQQNIAFGAPSSNFAPYANGHIPFSTNMSGPPNLSHGLGNGMSSWQHTQVPVPMSAPIEPYYYNTSIHPHGMSLDIKTEGSAPSPTIRASNSPRDREGEESPTLSPSTFLWQEMELPGCGDATGTCQCGDGCTCVGCLTHGGHNGVQLDTSAAGAVEFSDFIAGDGYGINNMDHMAVPSAEGPT